MATFRIIVPTILAVIINSFFTKEFASQNLRSIDYHPETNTPYDANSTIQRKVDELATDYYYARYSQMSMNREINNTLDKRDEVADTRDNANTLEEALRRMELLKRFQINIFNYLSNLKYAENWKKKIIEYSNALVNTYRRTSELLHQIHWIANTTNSSKLDERVVEELVNALDRERNEEYRRQGDIRYFISAIANSSNSSDNNKTDPHHHNNTDNDTHINYTRVWNNLGVRNIIKIFDTKTYYTPSKPYFYTKDFCDSIRNNTNSSGSGHVLEFYLDKNHSIYSNYTNVTQVAFVYTSKMREICNHTSGAYDRDLRVYTEYNNNLFSYNYNYHPYSPNVRFYGGGYDQYSMLNIIFGENYLLHVNRPEWNYASAYCNREYNITSRLHVNVLGSSEPTYRSFNISDFYVRVYDVFR